MSFGELWQQAFHFDFSHFTLTSFAPKIVPRRPLSIPVNQACCCSFWLTLLMSFFLLFVFQLFIAQGRTGKCDRLWGLITNFSRFLSIGTIRVHKGSRCCRTGRDYARTVWHLLDVVVSYLSNGALESIWAWPWQFWPFQRTLLLISRPWSRPARLCHGRPLLTNFLPFKQFCSFFKLIFFVKKAAIIFLIILTVLIILILNATFVESFVGKVIFERFYGNFRSFGSVCSCNLTLILISRLR